MKRRLVGLLVAGAVAGLPAAAPARAPLTAFAAKSCSSGYTHAVINGAHKCLRRGQFCSSSGKGQYPKYGYKCRYVDGYWRLV